ncbi:MAG: hypothetical protein KGM98_06170 [Bacteroidota bacterium]|nr:hypothetical protein [Bacteroidota bacterium]
MSITNKHLATMLLGAAAAFGAYKYSTMTEEERQKMADSIKAKFHNLKSDAEKSADTAKNYFSELKDKASEMLKEHIPGIEKHFEDFFGSNTSQSQSEPGGATSGKVTT